MSVDAILGLVDPNLLDGLDSAEISQLSKVMIAEIRSIPGLEEQLRAAVMPLANELLTAKQEA